MKHKRAFTALVGIAIGGAVAAIVHQLRKPAGKWRPPARRRMERSQSTGRFAMEHTPFGRKTRPPLSEGDAV